jgi:hypothetical protein
VIRGRVSKWVTNESKTAEMKVISFLCVSLGSRTVQLHNSRGSRRAQACSLGGFSIQNGRAEECIAEEQLSVVRFVWTKGLNAKDIHKETFPIYGGKCFTLKSVYNWVEKHLLRYVDEREDMLRIVIEDESWVHFFLFGL